MVLSTQSHPLFTFKSRADLAITLEVNEQLKPVLTVLYTENKRWLYDALPVNYLDVICFTVKTTLINSMKFEITKSNNYCLIIDRLLTFYMIRILWHLETHRFRRFHFTTSLLRWVMVCLCGIAWQNCGCVGVPPELQPQCHFGLIVVHMAWPSCLDWTHGISRNRSLVWLLCVINVVNAWGDTGSRDIWWLISDNTWSIKCY